MRKPDPIMGKERGNININNSKSKLRKGLWSPEEDEKLMNYMLRNGHGCWSDIARNAGLQRCGKSCRLRWINYLRPDLKRGAFSPQEEDLIIHLHSLLGNRWSQIAARLPGRTDNEIKNFWNSTVKKRLKNNNHPSSSSPNDSDSSADPIDQDHHHVMGAGIMSMHEQYHHHHDIMTSMCMDSSSSSLSSSSSSMQAMVVTGNHFDPFPLLDNYYDVNCAATGLFPVPTLLEQVGGVGNINGLFYGEDYGMVDHQRGKMGINEKDLNSNIIPPVLESCKRNNNSIEENYNKGAATDCTIDGINRTTEESMKVEDMFGGFGNNNHWQEGENLRMGEWDLEGLMQDVSSFPFLDFQV